MMKPDAAPHAADAATTMSAATPTGMPVWIDM